MSPIVRTSYTRHEVREVREAFRDWRFGPTAIEPDGRVTVLYDRQLRDASPGFLCRHQHGWFWVNSAQELEEKVKNATPYRWAEMITELGSGEYLVVPTEQELEIGGFRVTVEDNVTTQSAQPEDEESDEAKEQLDAGFQALGQAGFRSDGTQTMKAQAHFMASIAVSLYELVALHRKYDPDNLSVVVDPGPEEKLDEDQETRSAAGVGVDMIPGPVAGEDFPFAR